MLSATKPCYCAAMCLLALLVPQILYPGANGSLGELRHRAEALHYGRGVDPDPEEALRIARMLADQNDAVGCFIVGRSYAMGLGASRDIEKAIHWYEKASALGEVRAMNNLGLIFSEEGDHFDRESALSYMTESAEIGFANAQENLGRWYFQGQFVNADYEEAIEWFWKAHGSYEKMGEDTWLDRADCLEMVARAHMELGDYARALPLLERSLHIKEAALGPNHMDVAQSLLSLAAAHYGMGDDSKMVPLQERALRIAEESLGPDHLATAWSLHNLADTYSAMGNHDDAVSLYERALRIREKILGPDHLETASSLHDLADAYSAMENHAEAVLLWERALRIREEVLGPSDQATAWSLRRLIDSHLALGNHAEAIPLQERVLGMREMAPDPEDSLTERTVEKVMILAKLASSHRAVGNYEKAKQLYHQALDIKERSFSGDNFLWLPILGPLGYLYEETGDLVSAIKFYQRVLNIKEESSFLYDYLELLSDIEYLSTLTFRIADHETFIRLREKEFNIRLQELGVTDPATAATLASVGFGYHTIGDYAVAMDYYERAYRMVEESRDSDDYILAKAFILGRMAAHKNEIGQFAESVILFEESLKLIELKYGTEHYQYALQLGGFARLRFDLGENKEAMVLMEQSLSILEQSVGLNHEHVATVLGNLAAMHYSFGAYDEVLSLGLESLRINEEIYGPNHPQTAMSLGTVGSAHYAMGNGAAAAEVGERRLKINEQVLGLNHPHTALSMTSLAAVYRFTGPFEAAIALDTRALSIMRDTLGPSHPMTGRILRNMSNMFFFLGRHDEALAKAREHYRVIRLNAENVFSFGSEQQRMAFIAMPTMNPYSAFAMLDSTADLALALLQFKGSVLDSMTEDRARIEASANPRVAELYGRGRMLRAAHEAVEGSGDEAQARRRELAAEMDAVHRELTQLVSGIGMGRRAFEIAVHDVTSALPEGTVLVEFLRWDHSDPKRDTYAPGEHYGAMIYPSMATGQEPKWVPLGPAAGLDEHITRYKSYVRAVGRDEWLHGLYQAAMAPVLAALPDNTDTLILSPDGELNFVSFATLVDGNGSFLSERFNLRYVSSGRDLVLGRARTADPSVLLAALGNPAFDLDIGPRDEPVRIASGGFRTLDMRELRNLNLTPLPGAEAEVRYLGASAPGWGLDTVTYLGEEATEGAVRELSGPHILHLATHGFFLPDPESGPQQGLFEMQMIQGTEQFFPRPEPLSQQGSFKMAAIRMPGGSTLPGLLGNPMHRSGLALAGAQNTFRAWDEGVFPPADSDGILTADEVGLLDLDGTWLVVLSACDTGGGEARAGQGVLGLRRGFLYSGAQNLMLTLWPVDDAYTQRFMEEFYPRALKDGDAAGTLFELQRSEMVRIREEEGLAAAVRLAGPFVLNSNERIARGSEEVNAALKRGAVPNTKSPDGSTSLIMAAKNSNPEVITALLEGGADPNARDTNGYTAVMVAAIHNSNPEVIKALLNANGDPNAKSPEGHTALMMAVAGSNPEVIAALLKAGADPNSKDVGELTALMYAAQHNNDDEVFAALIEAGVDPNAKDVKGATALIYAAGANSNPEVTAVLLKGGADPNAADSNGFTALMVAIVVSNSEVINVLLNAGADPNVKNSAGFTALMLAARSNTTTEVIGGLLEAGADLHTTNTHESTALMIAAWGNPSPEVIVALVRAGSDLSAKDAYGNTALMLAGANPNPEVIVVLLDAGGDPNARCPNGETALMIAASNPNPEVVKIFANTGADLNAKDAYGRTALMIAAGNNANPEVITALVKAGADPNVKDRDGGTALMYAAVNNPSPKVTEALLKAGADFRVRAEDGKTALDLAREHENNSAMTELIKAGAR